MPQGAQPIGPGGANSVIPEVREHLWDLRQLEIKAIDPHASCSGERCMYADNFALVFESPKGTTSIGVGPGGIGRAAVARGTAAATQRGVSVLGHHPGYIDYAQSIGARYFKTIPPEIVARMGAAELRAANTRFLDRLVARGDIVQLSTPAAQARAGSTFAWELQYLQSKGYQLAADGMRMLPPGL